MAKKTPSSSPSKPSPYDDVVVVANAGHQADVGDRGVAIASSGGKAKAGVNGVAVEKGGSTPGQATAGVYGVAVSLSDNGMAAAGRLGVALGPGGHARANDGGVAFAPTMGSAVTGHYGVAVTRDFGGPNQRSTRSRGAADSGSHVVTYGIAIGWANGIVSGGLGALLVVQRWDKRLGNIFVTGVVDGVKLLVSVKYTVDADNKFVAVPNPRAARSKGSPRKRSS